jgi:hypothetical protein
MAEKPSLVHVEIFGQTYAVRAGTDPEYVEKLADECLRLRREAEDSVSASRAAGSGAQERAARLAKMLGSALGE